MYENNSQTKSSGAEHISGSGAAQLRNERAGLSKGNLDAGRSFAKKVAEQRLDDGLVEQLIRQKFKEAGGPASAIWEASRARPKSIDGGSAARLIDVYQTSHHKWCDGKCRDIFRFVKKLTRCEACAMGINRLHGGDLEHPPCRTFLHCSRKDNKDRVFQKSPRIRRQCYWGARPKNRPYECLHLWCGPILDH